MEDQRKSETDLESAANLLGYFDRQVLASYQNESHRYIIKSDFFEGKLEVTDEYYRELERLGRTDERVSIHFGYRTLKDGELAIVAWLPDLFEKSKTHVPRWQPFYLRSPEWTTDYDERFQNWVRRNLQGDWDIENGPSYQLAEMMNIINGLTCELVDCPLYKHVVPDSLPYPAAENTWCYQDSHKELYGYLIDGLDKDCIQSLAARAGRDIKIGNKNTLKSLYALLPTIATSASFSPAMETVSSQRRTAAHGVRPPAVKFQAFSQFTKDLTLCVQATRELLTALEQEFKMNGRRALERQTAKRGLPRIARAPESHYSIVQAAQMKGKTVERVEVGFREDIQGVHESEAMLIYFTDGSIIGLTAGSNAGDLADGWPDLHAEDFRVDFRVHWVPPAVDDAPESQLM
jgi:hypothetical protein